MVASVRECADYLNGTLMFSAIPNTPSFKRHFLPPQGNGYPQRHSIMRVPLFRQPAARNAGYGTSLPGNRLAVIPF
jgi:hypothetical protein